MRAVLLIAMLAFSSPAMLGRVRELGVLVKEIKTVDGNVDVYRLSDGCLVTFRGVPMQTVNLRTCEA